MPRGKVKENCRVYVGGETYFAGQVFDCTDDERKAAGDKRVEWDVSDELTPRHELMSVSGAHGPEGGQSQAAQDAAVAAQDAAVATADAQAAQDAAAEDESNAAHSAKRRRHQ